MHPSALLNCKRFFECYVNCQSHSPEKKIVEIGSLDVNGSLREVVPDTHKYIGVDFAEGKGVDVILTDPYALPFEDEYADIVVSSSCFEHSEMFWLLFLEILRILKPNGLFYLNVPSNGTFHRYPVDCWRFYPDSGNALVSWGKRNGFNPALLESYTSCQVEHSWNDYVAVFVKDASFASSHQRRITSEMKEFYNGLVHGRHEILNYSRKVEDQKKIKLIPKFLRNRIKVCGQ